jgi:hypothetical protein
MHRSNSTFLLFTALLSSLIFPQQAPPAKSKVVSILSDDDLRAITEPRQRASAEFEAAFAKIRPPDISKPLADPQDMIAIVTVTGVIASGADGYPLPRVEMRVEEMLRGAFRERLIHARSSWSPPAPELKPIPTSDGLPHGKIQIYFSSRAPTTLFDETEPRSGNRYVLGYSRIDCDGGMFVNGAVNLDDPKQAQLLPDVERFLAAEASASLGNVGELVNGLNDTARWIRDLSAQRLVRSDECNVTPSCQAAIVDAAGRLIKSTDLGDRWEALTWLEWISQPIGSRMSGPNGLPPMSGAAFRQLLVAAISDSNLVVGDKAFGQLELFDFYHHSGPGDCIEYVPALRKSARWTAEETKGVTIGTEYNLSFGFACNPQ